MSTKLLKWYRLDNSAKLYPIMTTLNSQSIYRVSVLLREDIEPSRLERAVALALEKYPIYNVRLRRGVFWYYFEENEKTPKVIADSGVLLEKFNPRQLNDFLFRVCYFKRKLSLDMFHVLTDGFGACALLKTIVGFYEQLGGKPVSVASMERVPSETDYEDGFKKHYAPETLKGLDFGTFIGSKSHKLSGEWFKGIGYGYIQGAVSASAVHAKAKEFGCSVTVLLTALAMKSIYEAAKFNISEPINIMVPISLRKLFPSDTMLNFVMFGSLRVLPKPEYTLQDYCDQCAEQLRVAATKENLQKRINIAVKGLSHPVFKLLPLPLKWLSVKLGRLFIKGGSQTMIFTNVGVVDAEGLDMQDLAITVNLSRNSAKAMSATAIGDDLCVSFSRLYRETEEEKFFFRNLAGLGLDVRIQSNLRERYGATEEQL